MIMLGVNCKLFKFYWYISKKRFAHALACLPSEKKNAIYWQSYAFYQLGMYRSVLACPPENNSARYLLAEIVSAAACGDRDKVESLLWDKQSLRLDKKKIRELAVALLAFYPDLSVSLLKTDRSSILKLAALISIGESSGAQLQLQACSNKLDRRLELPFYRSNLLNFSPEKQLATLNDFFARKKVAPVVLRNKKLPLGAMNIRHLESLKTVSGPLVSIVMTVFESAKRISFALDSLLNQTYKNIEIIVVDDASSDNACDVIEQFCEIDSRVRYVKLPLNVGTYVAKTIGVHLAHGNFVSCQDSDDWAHPQKIAIQMQPMLTDERIVFTTSNLIRIGDDGIFYARAVYPLVRLNHSSVLFRKDVVAKFTGFWDFVRTGADSEFLARLKLVFGEKSMRRISLPLSICAHRENSLMTSLDTGYCKSGISDSRLDYWEAFSKWHIDSLREKIVPRMPNNARCSRPFSVPDVISVPAADIEYCMKFLDIKGF